MKKILYLIVGFLLMTSSAYSAEEIKLDTNDFIPNVVATTNSTIGVSDEHVQLKSGTSQIVPLEETVIQNPETLNHHYRFYDELARTAHDVYNLKIENTNVPACLLKKPLTHEFEHGPLESIHTWGVIQMNNTTTIPEYGGGNDKFSVGLINAIIDGKFRGGKEDFRIMFDPTPQHKRGFTHQLIQDLYIETHRIPNNVIMFGNSRVGGGIEGTQSPYTLPFLNRSQISRNFGNIRKFGIRVKGNYALMDYDFGGYSSDSYFREFFPGVEFTGWINFKPLGKTNGKYGDLKIGGGISSGHNNFTYNVAGAYARYQYKKFRADFEFANADGYNGNLGLSKKHARGLYTTVYYRITPKVELLARYDFFQPDLDVSKKDIKEYVVGLNYYLKGQGLRFMLNYIFRQSDFGNDSHRIILGTQIML